MNPRSRRRAARLTLWFAASALVACRPSPTAAPPSAVEDTPSSPVPSSPGTELEDHLAQLDDEATRAEGLSGIERLVTAELDETRREALAQAIVPALVRLWDQEPGRRLTVLRVCLALRHPAAAPVWNRAIGLDGSAAAYDQTLIALDGVAVARATASTETVASALRMLVERPELDGGEAAGQIRKAMIDTLGALGDRRAVPVLVSVLERAPSDQPVVLHRAAAQALGRIGDPAAVEPLLTAPFRIPDAPSTRSLPEQAKTALVAIGEPAVPHVLSMLKGEHAEIERLFQEHALPPAIGVQHAAGLLGAIGSSTAVDELVRSMPSCKKRRSKKGADESTRWQQDMSRAVVANALGLIGDERAVEPLCRCSTASGNPADMVAIAEALGRIGGPRAAACLAQVIQTGRYDPDTVQGPEFEREIQWEAARQGILAAGPDDLPVIEAAMEVAGRRPEVAQNLGPWAVGVGALKRCRRDLDCWLETLADGEAPWFAREVAAVNAARLAPRDAAVAQRLVEAYDVANPDARVTMAWAAGRVMQGERCASCAQTLQTMLDELTKERLSPMFQLSVLMARYTVAKLRPPGG